MIKKGLKSIVSRMKGNKVVLFTYKGTSLIYQAIKKYFASGVFPLTLTNTVGSNLTNYKIEGNSLQDGTPSPDNPIEVVSVGDKTSNLADLSKTTVSGATSYTEFKYDNLTGTLELTSTPNAYDYTTISIEDLGLEIGKTYNYGGDIIVTGKTTNKNTNAILELGTTAYNIISITKNTTIHIQRTFAYTGQDKVNLRLFFNYGSDEPAKVTYKNIYVSEVRDEFEPYGYKIPVKASVKNLFNVEPITTNIYLEEPLCKIGDYIETLHYTTKVIKKQIKEIVLTGEENWIQVGADEYPSRYYALTIGTYNLVVAHSGLCSHLESVVVSSSNANIGIDIANSSSYMDTRILARPNLTVYPNLASWVEFLKEQNANGTPVKVLYVLSNPIEETIDLPSIPTLEGTTILDSDVTVQPSYVEVEYTNEKPKRIIPFILGNGDTLLDRNGDYFKVKGV